MANLATPGQQLLTFSVLSSSHFGTMPVLLVVTKRNALLYLFPQLNTIYIMTHFCKCPFKMTIIHHFAHVL